jgi:hypothetical protein
MPDYIIDKPNSTGHIQDPYSQIRPLLPSLWTIDHSSFLLVPRLTISFAVSRILNPPNSQSSPCRPYPPGELPLYRGFFCSQLSLLCSGSGEVGVLADRGVDGGGEMPPPSETCRWCGPRGRGEVWACLRAVEAGMVRLVGGRGDLERARGK